jgi:hypothetical protein
MKSHSKKDNLSSLGLKTRPIGRLCGNPQVLESILGHVQKEFYPRPGLKTPFFKMKNGIDHQLTWVMKGRLPSAIDRLHGNP